MADREVIPRRRVETIALHDGRRFRARVREMKTFHRRRAEHVRDGSRCTPMPPSRTRAGAGSSRSSGPGRSRALVPTRGRHREHGDQTHGGAVRQPHLDDRPRYARERRGENQHQIQCNDAAPIEETFPQLKRVLMREGLLKGRRAKRLA